MFPKLSAAFVLAGIVALATKGTLELSLRYFAATCLLVSAWLIVVALIRQRSLQGGLSELHEGLVFSLIAACAHFLAGLVS
jgi:hypothetical protein